MIVARALVIEAQDRLYELNYNPGLADGTVSRMTEQAIREFEERLGLAASGKLTQGLLRHLRSAGGLKPWGAIVFSEEPRSGECHGTTRPARQRSPPRRPHAGPAHPPARRASHSSGVSVLHSPIPTHAGRWLPGRIAPRPRRRHSISAGSRPLNARSSLLCAQRGKRDRMSKQ